MGLPFCWQGCLSEIPIALMLTCGEAESLPAWDGTDDGPGILPCPAVRWVGDGIAFEAREVVPLAGGVLADDTREISPPIRGHALHEGPRLRDGTESHQHVLAAARVAAVRFDFDVPPHACIPCPGTKILTALSMVIVYYMHGRRGTCLLSVSVAIFLPDAQCPLLFVELRVLFACFYVFRQERFPACSQIGLPNSLQNVFSSCAKSL